MSPLPAVPRRILVLVAVVGLFLGLYGTSLARAEGPVAGPTPTPSAAQTAVASPVMGYYLFISYCWCPDEIAFSQTQIVIDPAQGPLVFQDNLQDPAVVIDERGAVVARIKPEGVAIVRLTGTGTHRYQLVAPKQDPPPAVTVVVEQRQAGKART